MMHEESDIPVIPVIVLTYGRDRGVLYRLAPYRINDFQTKPLSVKRLEQRIQSILTCGQPVQVPVSPMESCHETENRS